MTRFSSRRTRALVTAVEERGRESANERTALLHGLAAAAAAKGSKVEEEEGEREAPSSSFPRPRTDGQTNVEHGSEIRSNDIEKQKTAAN